MLFRGLLGSPAVCFCLDDVLTSQVWHGFVAMRGWRDCRVPQECLIRFLSGALAQLDESVAQEPGSGVYRVWPSLRGMMGRPVEEGTYTTWT